MKALARPWLRAGLTECYTRIQAQAQGPGLSRLTECYTRIHRLANDGPPMVNEDLDWLTECLTRIVIN